MKAIPFIFLILVTFTAQADDITWTGTVSTDWDYEGNWSPSVTPGPNDDAVIPASPIRMARYDLKVVHGQKQ